MTTLSTARSLKSTEARLARKDMLCLPHIAPLTLYCQALRAEGRGTVPDFDPLDGGTAAEVLFLMEKPGPMTVDTGPKGRIGSGFISRDNDDRTAEAILNFMAGAGIPRERSLLWNIVPWWNGTRDISSAELTLGRERLASLLGLLPQLKAVIGVGAKAQTAKDLATMRNLPFILSAHPSPINKARRRAVWELIPSQWAEAKQFLSAATGDGAADANGSA